MDSRKRSSIALPSSSPAPKRTCRREIKLFWEQHYEFDASITQTIKITRVLQHFDLERPGTSTRSTLTDRDEFHSESMRQTSLKSKKGIRNKPAYYFAKPKSDSAIEFHKTPEDTIELHVANIQGLICQSRNKCGSLKATVTSEVNSKLIAITESHLHDGIFDAEIQEVFKDYSITRCDRDTNFEDSTASTYNPSSNNAQLDQASNPSISSTQTSTTQSASSAVSSLNVSTTNLNTGATTSILTSTILSPDSLVPVSNRTSPVSLLTNSPSISPHDSDHPTRALSKGGGCLLLTSPDIAVDPKVTYSNGNCELIISELTNLDTSIIILYRPSGVNFQYRKFAEVIKKCKDYLEKKTADNPVHKLILVGDFNFPPEVVDWIQSEEGVFANVAPGQSTGKRAFRLLNELVEKMGMEQLVNQGTRGDRILDLVFSNTGELFTECKTETILSDHKLVSFGIDFTDNRERFQDTLNTPPTGIRALDFKRANKAVLGASLAQFDWTPVIGDINSIESGNSRFTAAIETCAAASNVPLRNQRSSRENRADDATKRLVLLKKNKEAALKSSTPRSTDRPRLEDEIKSLTEQIQATIESQRADRERKVIENMKTNPREFFRFASSTRKSKANVGPLKVNNRVIANDKDKAEAMSRQYSSMYCASTPFGIPDPVSSHSPTPSLTEPIVGPGLHDIDLTEDKFMEAIKSLDANSAPGPDGIPASVYKDYATQLVGPMCKLQRIALDTGKTTEGVAEAIITPLHKGGSKCEPANYRPVALTNHDTKIFERVLRKEIVKYLEDNNLTNVTQHGFTARKSTISQILSYLDDVYRKLEEGVEVDAVYLDFAKAFDKVDHGILLKKLYRLKIQGRILKWIGSFLRDRVQRVRVGNVLSDPARVTSGVPQGSVLGPVLFLVMMIDIDSNINNSSLGSFADDTKVWGDVDAQSVEQGVTNIQDDLNSLYLWARNNNMVFNDKKFQGLSFGISGRSPHYTTGSGESIEFVDCVKDLGVLVESNLHFNKHIRSMAAKGHRIAEWSFRTISDRSTPTLKTILKCLVIPQFESQSVIWSPHDQDHINMLEGVQRRFTSRFPAFRAWDSVLDMEICNIEYKDRLESLGLYSIQRRHERYLILYTYKIANKFVPNPGFTIDYDPRRKLRVNPITSPPHAPTWVKNARSHSFFERGPRLFNKLPVALRERADIPLPTKSHLDTYKRQLDKHLHKYVDYPGRSGNGLPQDGRDGTPSAPLK